MNQSHFEQPLLPPLQNADRVNLLERSIEMVGDRYITVNDGFEIRHLLISTNQYGEKFVAINQQPEEQRFVSLLMKPACRLADVVRVADVSSDEGSFQYYSHMINLDTIEAGSQEEMLADMFLLDAVTSEYDHYPTPSMRFSGVMLYKNTIIRGGADYRYYGFDYHAAFDPNHILEMETTRGAIIEADLRILHKLFGPDPMRKLPPPWLNEAELQNVRDVVRVGATKALPLIQEKIQLMRQLYDGEEGYELFTAMLAQSGIDPDLSQIFGDKAKQKWENPTLQFYDYVRFRIQVAADLIESFAADNQKI